MDSPLGPSSRDGEGDADDTFQTPVNDGVEPTSPAAEVEVEVEVEPVTTPSTSKNEQDAVTEAGRSIRTLLKDVLDSLKTRSDASVKLEGELKLTIGDRQSYALAVSDNSTTEESRLIIKINPLTTPSPTFGALATSSKRFADFANDSPAAKRQKQNGHPSQLSPSSTPDLAAAATARASISLPDGPQPDAPEDFDPDAPFDLQKDIKTLSNQIKWVEDCRRTASSEYHRREERWRTTSATFHDQNRIKRERHEAWVAGEMARQTNMLGQVIQDVKGLYPLLHSVKWETPTAAPHPLYATSVLPPTPHFAQGNNAIVGNGHEQMHTPTGRGTAARARPRGRPRGNS